MGRGRPAKQAARTGGETESANGAGFARPLADFVSPPDPPLRGAASHCCRTPRPRRAPRWSRFSV